MWEIFDERGDVSGIFVVVFSLERKNFKEVGGDNWEILVVVFGFGLAELRIGVEKVDDGGIFEIDFSFIFIEFKEVVGDEDFWGIFVLLFSLGIADLEEDSGDVWGILDFFLCFSFV